eukprot:5213982-Pyramimonas_sp.AAC.1
MFIREALLATFLKHLAHQPSGRALRMLARASDPPKAGEPKSCLRSDDKSISLTLRWRKIRASPITMSQTCWCARCKTTCPVHTLGKLCAEVKSGQPIEHFRPDVVSTAPRAAQHELGVSQHH